MNQGSQSTSRLYLAQDMQQPETVEVAGGVAAVFSGRCPAKQTPNEDAAAIISVSESSAVLAVADGMGGSAAGEQAAKLAVKSLRRAINAADDTTALMRTAIINGLEQANQAILNLGIGAATTLAVVELDGESIRPYHVGDAEVVLSGGRGKIKFQTVAHSPVAYGVEAGLLDKAEALTHEDRHLVSNFIGSTDMRIDIGPTRRLRPRDTVLLGTDGVFDNVHVEELIELIRKGPLAVAAEKVRNLVERRMNDSHTAKPSKPDDATFVIFRRIGK